MCDYICHHTWSLIEVFFLTADRMLASFILQQPRRPTSQESPAAAAAAVAGGLII
jgi:hypothetical protein